MTDKPAHLCLTCNLAEWHRTANGRRHPDGQGKCGWKPLHIPTAAVWKWDTHGAKQPRPIWGQIERLRHITVCETYQEKIP